MQSCVVSVNGEPRHGLIVIDGRAILSVEVVVLQLCVAPGAAGAAAVCN